MKKDMKLQKKPMSTEEKKSRKTFLFICLGVIVAILIFIIASAIVSDIRINRLINSGNPNITVNVNHSE